VGSSQTGCTLSQLRLELVHAGSQLVPLFRALHQRTLQGFNGPAALLTQLQGWVATRTLCSQDFNLLTTTDMGLPERLQLLARILLARFELLTQTPTLLEISRLLRLPFQFSFSPFGSNS
jgi:hypothetical protein